MNPGDLIGGKYRLIRRLGVGAMGIVWAAVNETLSREVAIKFILRSTPELEQRLLREARACGVLRHPNVIDVLDVGETDEGEPFLVMELLVGETLSEHLVRHRRLDAPEAARIGRDVARALAAAHAANIVHRDLKPANIFLHQTEDSEGKPSWIVKVVDFGVSKNLAISDGLATATGGIVGSPGYMSPEQAKAQRDVDHRSDLWALGVLLFEMLTGVRPFKGDTPQLLMAIAFGEIPQVSRDVRIIDPAFVELVSHCLTRDRDKRFQSAAEVATQLQRFMRAAPTAPRSAEGMAPQAVDDDDLAETAQLSPARLLALFRPPRTAGPPPSTGPLEKTALLAAFPQGRNPAPRFGTPPPLPTSPFNTAPLGPAVNAWVERSPFSSAARTPQHRDMPRFVDTLKLPSDPDKERSEPPPGLAAPIADIATTTSASLVNAQIAQRRQVGRFIAGGLGIAMLSAMSFFLFQALSSSKRTSQAAAFESVGVLAIPSTEPASPSVSAPPKAKEAQKPPEAAPSASMTPTVKPPASSKRPTPSASSNRGQPPAKRGSTNWLLEASRKSYNPKSP